MDVLMPDVFKTLGIRNTHLLARMKRWNVKLGVGGVEH